MNGRFIERTILGVVSLLKETVSTDAIACRKGFLQDCDPRLKCLSIALLLLVCAPVTKSIAELAALYAGC